MKTQILLSLKAKLILSLIAFFFSQVAFAAIVLGSDISYQCTTTPGVYKVSVKLYRQCAGIEFCSSCNNPIPTGSVGNCIIGPGVSLTGKSATCSGTNFGNFSYLIAVPSTSAIEIIKTCNVSNASKTICTNCNTRTAGTFGQGIEVYTFEGNIDLNALPANCCEVVLSYSQCCRSGSINTFSGSANLYTEAVINRCITPCNSAPVFTNDATALICAGQDVSINLGAIDPDGDSLSYSFGQTLQSAGQSVNYTLPYSSSYPFPYFGAPTTNAPFPAGLRLDPVTGNLNFRPTGTWVSNLVIEVTQWKLIGGNYTNVGVTRRDVQLQSISCAANLPPKILVYKDGIKQTSSTNYIFETYPESQICLDIVAEDGWNYSNPDSSFWIRPDTTHLTWNNPGTINNLMSNATWTRNYILSQRAVSGPKNDSFKFCWTPPINITPNAINAFTVTGKDNYCPLPAFVQTAISIKVVPSIQITNISRNVFCNESPQSFTVNYVAGVISLNQNNQFKVELSSSFGSFVSPTVVGVKSSTSYTGTINAIMPSGLLKNANYKIRVVTSSITSNSFNINAYPVSFVTGFNKPTIVNILDSICYGTKVVFKSNLSGSNYNYQWLKNNNPILVENKDSLLADTTASYRLIVSNSVCRDTSDSKSLFAHPKPTVGFNAPNLFCLKSEALNHTFLNTSLISNGSLNYLWKFSDNTSSSLTNPIKSFNDTGSIVVKLIAISLNNCVDSIEKSIVIKQSPLAAFGVNNLSQCFENNSFVFSNLSNSYNQTTQFNWNLGEGNSFNYSNSQITYKYTKAGLFKVRLVASTNIGCTDSIEKEVTVFDNPAANFNLPSSICIKNNPLTINVNNTSTIKNGSLSYNWFLPNNSASNEINALITLTNIGIYTIKLKAISDKGCVDSISKNIIVNSSPSAFFELNSHSQCFKGNSFAFNNLSNNANTYNWDFGDFTSSTAANPTVKNYSKSGVFNVKLIAKNILNCYDTAQKELTVISNLSIGKVLGDTSPNSLTNLYPYSVASQAGATYNWAVTNGNILSGQGTNTVNLKWNSKGAGTIKAVINKTNFCADSNVLAVSVNPVGIEKLSLENDLKVYPNPAKTEIIIKNKNGWTGKQFVISNIIGQELLRGKLNQDETTINLSELKAGTYLLSIDGITKQAIKIMKEE